MTRFDLDALRRARILATAWWLVLAAAGSAHAATVEILLRERGGPVLPAERVYLADIVGVDPTSPRVEEALFRGSRSAMTDPRGIAIFAGTRPGMYLAVVMHPSDPTLLTRSTDPLSRPQFVELREDQERVRAVLELTRGMPVRLAIRSDKSGFPPAKARLLHVETGFTLEAVMRPDVLEAERALAPGTWRIGLEPPTGFIISDITRDGWPVDGCEVRLAVEDAAPQVDVTWTIEGRAAAQGVIHDQLGHCGASGARATLVLASAAVEASRARGCPVPDVIDAGIDPERCRWSMTLPDGTWAFAPIVPAGVIWEPEAAAVEIVVGTSVTVDFKTTWPDGIGKEPAKSVTASMVAEVLDPDGLRVDADVSIWPADADGSAGAPIARQRTRRGVLGIGGLEPRPLRVVASDPAFLEGETTTDAWELPPTARLMPEDAGERLVTIRLRRGCALAITATDGALAPASGVMAIVEANGEPPAIVRLAGTIDRWRFRAGATDGDGKIVLSSIHPGPHVLTARLAGERATTHLVQVREPGQEWAPSLALDLEEGPEPRPVEIRVVEAGSLEAELRCDGGGRLPPIADFRAVPALAVHLDETSNDDALAAAKLVRDGLALRGDARDAATMGPLPPGGWLLAIRPDGFDRWTWAPGQDALADAMTTIVEPGDATPLPPILIDCMPVVRLGPIVPEGLPIPNLRDAKVAATWLPVDAQQRHEGRGGALVAKRFVDRVDLRGATEGKASLHAEVSHPHFLPAAPIAVDASLELRDGRVARVPLPIADVGGAVDVRAERGTAIARAAVADAIEVREDVVEGHALLAHLPAGRYDVSLVDGDTKLRSWPAIDVERAKTTRVGEP